jgi:Sulfotransferase family
MTAPEIAGSVVASAPKAARPGPAWSPPPRPDWVRRVNDEGRWMNLRGVVPLDVDSLLRSAREATGLDDFGADDWFEPFEVLVRSLETESELNLVGRLRTRSELLQLLEARLRVEDTVRRHPQIADEEITKPFVIIGQGRSGTSMLHNLMGADPDNGVIKTWEAILPCPPPEAATYLTDPRRGRGHQLIDQWNRVTPSIRSMHEFSGDMPQECVHVMSLNFNCPHWFNALGQVPTYNHYTAGLDPEPTYRYHRKVLQLLQWRNPRRNWVLKAPAHLDALPVLLRVFPDAGLIWPHRDPVRALASTISLVATMQWGRSDFPLMARDSGSYDSLTDARISAARLTAVIDLLESGAVPRERLCNVAYAELMADPIATVARIYDHFGVPFTEAGRSGMADYQRAHSRDARPAHAVAAGDADTVARMRAAYQRYQRYFNVPDE